MPETTDAAVDTFVPDDISWLRSSFLLPADSVDEYSIIDRNKSSADDKYVNSTIGGNFAINVPPQFTHTADPKIEGLGLHPTADRPSPMHGLGRYYSEAIDDNNEIITMRFGTLQFNTLLGFLARAYSINYAKMARTGTTDPSFSFQMGRIVGFVITAPMIPPIMMIRGLFAIFNGAATVGKNLASLIFGPVKIPGSRYAYLKTAMPMYWATVNQMANTLAVNMGLIPPASFFNSGKDGNPVEKNGHYFARLSDEDSNGIPTEGSDAISLETFNRFLPDFIRDGARGGINVRAIAGRAEQIRVRRTKKLASQLDDMLKGNDRSKLDALAQLYKEKWAMPMVNTNQPVVENKKDGYDYLRKIVGEEISSEEAATAAEAEEEDNINWYTRSFGDYFTLDTLAGANWVHFRVTGDKAISESFDNQVGESELATTLKAKAGRSKDAAYATAAGNVVDFALFNFAKGIGSKIKDVTASLAESLGVGGFAATLSGAYLDFPSLWKDSTANLPKMEYKIELRATYGNKMSVFMDIYIPLCMILAATLPLSAGKASYVSPFLCEIYHKGRAQSRMAIVDKVTISRGVGNLGWTVDNLPMAVDVSLSIADLTNVIHAPIDDSIASYEDDSGYNNYMAVLGAMGVVDQVDFFPKFYRSKARVIQKVSNLSNPAAWGMDLSDTLGGRAFNHIVKHIGDVYSELPDLP